MTPHEIADLLEGRADTDETAADAYELFGRCVFPFEGVFLDESASARGPLSEALRADPPPASLRTWVPAFACALLDLQDPLAVVVAGALRDVVLGLEPNEAPTSPTGESVDLGDPSVGLHAIVDYLATPARSGIFLSAGVVERIARSIGVPRGFGSRGRLLRELLLAASRYGRLDDAVGALADLVRDHAERMMADWPQQDVAPWIARLVRTGTLLRELAARASVDEPAATRL